MSIIKQTLVSSSFKTILLDRSLCNGISVQFDDTSDSFSHINGVRYPTYLTFDTEQDLLFFMLKFPGVIKFPTKESDVREIL